MASGTWMKGMKLVEGIWHYRFMWEGVRYDGSTKIPGYVKAKAWVDAYKLQLANRVVGIAKPPTVAKALEHWQSIYLGKLSKAHTDRMESAFRLHILPNCGEMTCDVVTKDIAELIRSRYLEGGSQRKHGKQSHTISGANTLLGYLKALLIHALGRCPYRLKSIKQQEIKRDYVPKELVPAFLAEIDRVKRSKGTQTLHRSIVIRAMLYLGLRESEATKMQWGWFSPDLSTYCPGKTKGKEALELPVHPDLKLWLLKLPNRLGLVLPGFDKEGNLQAHTKGFSKVAIKAAGLKVGVANLSPHRLRTTTLMAQAGVNIKTIQRQLRHRDLRTTCRYIQVGLDDLVAAQKTLWGV